MGLTLVTAPAVEPLTLTEAKSWLRIADDVTDDDTDIETTGIPAARTRVENATNRALITQTWRLTLRSFTDRRQSSREEPPEGISQYAAGSLALAYDPAFGATDLPGTRRQVIRLPKGPIQAEDSGDVTVTYLDTNGVWQTLSASLFELDASEEPAVLAPAYGQVWPATRPALVAVKIEWDAGYGDAGADVPADIQKALRLFLEADYADDAAKAKGLEQAALAILGKYWIGDFPGEVL